MSLDKENIQPAYRLGRLLAVLERLQGDAQRSLNKTIVDRYYGAASTRPGTVFPALIRLAQHHFPKVSSPGFHQANLGEVLDGIATFPATLSLEQQGLFNRREMDRLLKEEMARAQRHLRPLSLLMVDIDWFKRVNDTYGHQVGDKAIREVARVVLDSVRALDRAARYGGEELAVILPETSSAEAWIVAERIRERVAHTAFFTALDGSTGPTLTLTVSVGISTMSAPGHGGVERLIGEADGALYAAKQGGRNRTVAHGAGDGAAAVSSAMAAVSVD